jgi:hypothetical protein
MAESAKPDAILLAELSHYKQRCQRAEQELESLKTEGRFLDSLSGSPDVLRQRLYQKEKQYRNAQAQLKFRVEMERYLAIGDTRIPASNENSINSYFQELKAQLSTVLVLYGSRKPSVDQLYGQSTDLDDMLSTLFPEGNHHRLSETRNIERAPTLCELVQALTGASIHHWIFQGDFRPHSLTVTPLMHKFQEFIKDLCMYRYYKHLQL